MKDREQPGQVISGWPSSRGAASAAAARRSTCSLAAAEDTVGSSARGALVRGLLGRLARLWAALVGEASGEGVAAAAGDAAGSEVEEGGEARPASSTASTCAERCCLSACSRDLCRGSPHHQQPACRLTPKHVPCMISTQLAGKADVHS